MAQKSKTKPKYQDKPRFKLIEQYEESAKRKYDVMIVDMVKMLGTKMLGMAPADK